MRSKIGFLLSCLIFCVPTAHAAPSFKTDFLLTYQYITEDNDDLNTRNKAREESHSGQARMITRAKLTDKMRGFLDIRYLKITGDSGFVDDTGQTLDKDFVEVRRYGLYFDKFLGYRPLSLKVGRQRITEPRTLWWNRDIDAVKLGFNKTLHKGFVGLGQNVTSYRSTHDDFKERDEDRLRIFGESSWQYTKNHYLDARFHYEHDYSKTETVGQLVPTDDRDLADADLLWAGFRSWGSFDYINSPVRSLDYRFDAIAVAGDEKTLATGAGPDPSLRSVTGITDQDVRGWAVDTDVHFRLSGLSNTNFILGYAFGSGDDNANDGTDHAFRQTGLEGNATRIGLASQGIRHFGEILRPELSNMHIVTAGGNQPVFKNSDFNVLYHYYYLDEPTTSLRSSGVGAPLDGVNKNVGHAVDMALNLHLHDELNLQNSWFDRTIMRIVGSGFFAGDAYGANAEDENSYRLFTELQLWF